MVFYNNPFKEKNDSIFIKKLHSITGVFVEDFMGISPWGGHFLREEDGEGIEGLLIDMYGPSSIEGGLGEDYLSFKKSYLDCNSNQEFNYDFVLENGVWRVGWNSDSGYRGESICVTHPILTEGLSFKMVELNNPEQYASHIIRSMIQSRQLETYTDEKTGEEMITPVKKDGSEDNSDDDYDPNDIHF